MADASPRADGLLNGVGRCLWRIFQRAEGERFGGFDGWIGNVERERNAELFVSLQIEMDRIENIDYLIGGLLREQQREMALPGTLEEKQALLRALMNIRPPWPATDEWLRCQDRELAWQLEDKGIVELEEMETVMQSELYTLRLWQGDITRVHADAIVNAANSQMLGCFVPLHRCIDNAIHSAAGIQLRLECARIVEGDEPTGSARITGGYNLPSRHVIHTVGPIIPNGVPTAEQERQLASSYRSCLSLADEKGLTDIVFCCISTGEYRFPNQRAARIAVDTVRQYMEGYRRNMSLKTVVFNVYKDIDYDAYRAIFEKG